MPGDPKFEYEDNLPPMSDEEQAEIAARVAKSDKAKGLAARMLKLYLTPRQQRLLKKLKADWGMSVSEHVRRAIDLYLDGLVDRGDLKDE